MAAGAAWAVSEVANVTPHPVTRPLLVEVAGPAGAGKTSLTRSLLPRLNGASGSIWGRPVFDLLGNGVQLMPTFGPLWLHSRSLLWRETRHIVRLQTLYRALQTPSWSSPEILIFDEGPVFSMAWLRGFGHETMRQPPSAEWWRTAVRDWASVIDMVVVLDAPDRLLAERIRTRAHEHEVKEYSDLEIACWMARFRAALNWVLEEMSRHGGPQVVRLSSDDHESPRIAEKLLEELSGNVYGR